MAYDKLVDSIFLEGLLKSIADAIRKMEGTNDKIEVKDMPERILHVGGSNKFYECYSVGEFNTWSGYEWVLVEKQEQYGETIITNKIYQKSSTITEGLIWSHVIPEVGKSYSPDALIVANLYEGYSVENNNSHEKLIDYLTVTMPEQSYFLENSNEEIYSDKDVLDVIVTCNGVNVSSKIECFDGEKIVNPPFYPSTAKQRLKITLNKSLLTTPSTIDISFTRDGVEKKFLQKKYTGVLEPEYFTVPKSDDNLSLYINAIKVPVQCQIEGEWVDVSEEGISTDYFGFPVRAKENPSFPAIAKWHSKTGGFSDNFLYLE